MIPRSRARSAPTRSPFRHYSDGLLGVGSTLRVLVAFGSLATGTAVATAAGPAAPAQQKVPVETVVARAGEYVAKFVDAFSNVVAEERYTQDVSGTASGTARAGHRELRSDVLLLKVGGPLEWRPYRDVFEVDGKPVHNRDDRLMTLFQRPGLKLSRCATRPQHTQHQCE